MDLIHGWLTGSCSTGLGILTFLLEGKKRVVQQLTEINIRNLRDLVTWLPELLVQLGVGSFMNPCTSCI